MNKVSLSVTTAAFFLFNSVGHSASNGRNRADALRATTIFWDASKEFDAMQLSQREKDLIAAWAKTKEMWHTSDTIQLEEDISILEKAEKNYRMSLENYPSSSDAYEIRLSLAKTLIQIAQMKNRRQSESGDQQFQEAIAVLADFEDIGTQTLAYSESLFLKARILEQMEEHDQAYEVWRTLAKSEKKSIYSIHANTALGDRLFTKEKPAEALTYYRRSIQQLDEIATPDRPYEKLRLNYRLAWSAYRSGNLEECIAASIRLIEGTRDHDQVSIREKVEGDGTELLADAIFESNQPSNTLEILRRPELRPFVGRIGLRIMKNLTSLTKKDEISKIGKLLSELTPNAAEMPEILSLVLDTLKDTPDSPEYLETLERMAIMLPSNSLWRTRNRNAPQAIASMEERALASNKILAGIYYEKGMTSNNPQSLKTAASYYSVLAANFPKDQQKEIWKLRIAHCSYFSGKWEEAEKFYAQVLAVSPLSPETLEMALYQQVLSREKIWRESFQRTLSETSKHQKHKDPILVEKLRALESSIDTFANRFPLRSTSTDLLLLAASANRDLDNFNHAENYWNRALLNEPNAQQRIIALRGVIQSKIRSGNTESILTSSRDILKLENFKDLGESFHNEMRGILLSSLRDRSDELSKDGKIEESGHLLLRMAEDFPDLPERDKVIRDGAYQLALAGSWQGSLTAANTYLASGASQKNADMLYLKARSLEYQFNFLAAAENYLQLGEKYAKHPRALTSLQRSEQLAKAENAFHLAGSAATALASREKDSDKRIAILERASQYYTMGKDWKSATKSLEEADKIASQINTKFRLSLHKARIFEEQGQLSGAASILRKVMNDAESLDADLKGKQTKEIIAESSFRIGQILATSFEQDGGKRVPSSGIPQIERSAQSAEEIINFYNKAIAQQIPRWTSRAREAASKIAEKMSYTMREAIAKSPENIPQNMEMKFSQQASRWKSLANEFKSQDLLDRSKYPHKYFELQNEDLESRRVATSQPSNDADYELPGPATLQQPVQWSH